MRYKCGSCGYEFNLLALACPACHSEQVYQSLKDSDSSDLDRALERDFKKDYCHPSTGLGNFDIHYSAAKRVITITVKIHSNYNGHYFSLLSEEERVLHNTTKDKLLKFFNMETGKVPSSHETAVILEFDTSAKKAIPLTWNNRFSIINKRFDGPAIKIEFKLETTDLAASHYEVEISDANTEMNNQATVREVGRKSGTSYHHAVFTSDVTGTSGASFKREEIVRNLVSGYKIAFPNYNKSTFGASSSSPSIVHHVMDHTRTSAEQIERAGKQILRDFSSEVRKVLGGADYKKFKIMVEITAPFNRTGSLLEYIFSELNPQEIGIARRNIKNLFTPTGSEERHITISLASADYKCITPDQHVQQILLDTTVLHSPKCCPDQNTISHEFGHMLGLPDEYVCLSRSLKENYRNLGMNVFRSDHSFESWANLQLKDNGKDLDPIASKNQEMFLILCDKAQVPPPLFGHSTTSLMSAGSVLQKHHAVTILEAFCSCMGGTTQIDDWEIQLI